MVDQLITFLCGFGGVVLGAVGVSFKIGRWQGAIQQRVVRLEETSKGQNGVGSTLATISAKLETLDEMRDDIKALREESRQIAGNTRTKDDCDRLRNLKASA